MIKLEPDGFYHIYNRGINSCKLFLRDCDFENFLKLYRKYIDPIAVTYAWVLMGNHFHTLIRIKNNICYKYEKADEIRKGINFNSLKWETTTCQHIAESESDSVVTPDSVAPPGPGIIPPTNIQCKKPKPSKHFSHLFSSYTLRFNTKYIRHGALFERPFKRKIIKDDEHLKNVILYIHNNPTHHGICLDSSLYRWSSYNTYLDSVIKSETKNKVIALFNDIDNFKYVHKAYGANCEDMLE